MNFVPVKMGISFTRSFRSQVSFEVIASVVGSTDPPVAAWERTGVFAFRAMFPFMSPQMFTPLETRSTRSAIFFDECTSKRLLVAGDLKVQWLQTTLSTFTSNIESIDGVMAVGSTIAGLTEPWGCTLLLTKHGFERYEFLFRGLKSFRFHHEVVFVLRMCKVHVLRARWADHVIVVERHRGGCEAVTKSVAPVWRCVVGKLLFLVVVVRRQL